PCPHLAGDFRCAIHDRLRRRGFPGCAAYDCFGAGQHVSLVTFGGRDWRRDPGIAEPMFAAFEVVRRLHELLWYLAEALALRAAGQLHDELRRAHDETERLAGATPERLRALDPDAHGRAVHALLRRASALARGGGRDRAGADLAGANLRGADLHAAD